MTSAVSTQIVFCIITFGVIAGTIWAIVQWINFFVARAVRKELQNMADKKDTDNKSK